MKKNVHNTREFRTKIMIHEVHKCKKEKEKKNAITTSIISNNLKDDGGNTTVLKKMIRKAKKKNKKYKTSTQLNTISPKKKLYTKTCDKFDKFLNKNKTTPTNSKKDRWRTLNPVLKASEDDKEFTLLKRKRRRGKKKKQKNKNSKTDKLTFNKEKHSNIQSNEDNISGFNKHKKVLNRKLADTSTNTVISLATDKLNSSILKPQIKIIKKKMDKKPKIQSINILENNVICTEKKHCQIKQCLEFLLNCHDHKTKTYKAYKGEESKKKKKKKRNFKMAIQEVTKQKYSKINEYLETDIFKSHSKKMCDATIITPYYNSRILKDNEKNPLLLKKSFKKKKKKKKKAFKVDIQEKIIPLKKDAIERQQSITTSEINFSDNDIATDCKNYDRDIFKKYFEFLSAHTVNDKDAAIITPYYSSKPLMADDDNPLLSNKSPIKKEKSKASKAMTSEIMIPKKSKKSKRLATLVNEYSGKDIPQIVSMDMKTYNSEAYVCEDSENNLKFFYDRDDDMMKADIDNDKNADIIKTTYFSKSSKDNKENTLISKTLVKKLKKQKRKHEMEMIRAEVTPLKKNALLVRKRSVTECNEYSENDIAEIPLYTPAKGVYHIKDYEPVVEEKFLVLCSVRDKHQTKEHIVGNDEGTSYMIIDTNIKPSNVQPPCVTESIQIGKSSIECDICSKTFISKYKLSIHYRTHTGEKPYECDLCSRCFTQRSTLVTHYRTHTGEKPYECDLCSRCFTQRSSLITHYRTHTGEKPYECDLCYRCFSVQSNLVKHYRTHTGEKPYKCNLCSRYFTRRSTLVKHYRTHTGKKPYVCDICRITFSQESMIFRHYRMHSAEIPYAMSDIFSESFTQQTNLQNVSRTNMGEEPYSCEVCGRLFADLSTSIEHYRRTHASEGVYECSLCKKSFLSCIDHTRHMRLNHHDGCF